MVDNSHPPPPYSNSIYPNPPQPFVRPIQQTVIINQKDFGPFPIRTTCPNCRSDIQTTISSKSGLLTWLIAGTLCFFACWAGCCLVPFCVDSCRDVVHSCPNCGTDIGLFKRL